MRERVCVCVHACMHARMCVCVCVCVCVLDREGSWVFARTALEVVWLAMHLTGQWLSDQFLWTTYSTFQMSCWFVKCLVWSLVRASMLWGCCIKKKSVNSCHATCYSTPASELWDAAASCSLWASRAAGCRDDEFYTSAAHRLQLLPDHCCHHHRLTVRWSPHQLHPSIRDCSIGVHAG